MLDDIKKVKDKVAWILNKFSSTRDSDKLLWISYLVIYHDLRNQIGDEAYTKMKAIIMDKNTASMESVRRVRQKLQEDGLYLGENRRQRLDESGEVREYFKNSKGDIK